ncbi:hypothetical protein CP367_08985 [Lactobacillus sp. UMNPBX16]|nr:hypothetical protein CP367_08985 [Lactobacillus sp. UMNPBX16]PEG97933.1 hypothetical protein CP359_09915 [Lactobacillus sp. UMNPBX8]
MGLEKFLIFLFYISIFVGRSGAPERLVVFLFPKNVLGNNGNKQGNETMKQTNKLYNQTELANKLGISKGTLSKWINKNNVSPEKVQGNKKLYKETLINKYYRSKNVDDVNNDKPKRESFSSIEFLKKQVEIQQETIERLQKKLDEKDKVISDFGQKFAKLADQAQQLNLVDKPQLIHKDGNSGKNVSVAKEKTTKEKRPPRKRHWWWF